MATGRVKSGAMDQRHADEQDHAAVGIIDELSRQSGQTWAGANKGVKSVFDRMRKAVFPSADFTALVKGAAEETLALVGYPKDMTGERTCPWT